jgi:hypothetical protein
MTRYERVKQILDQAVNNADIGAHRAFWRTLTRDAFVQKSVFGLPLVKLGDGPNSNLVLALRGRAPFGANIGTPNGRFNRMPDGFPPVADADIAFIQTWINDRCPEDAMPLG